VVLCQIPNQEWLLQIAHERSPGFVGRLIGRNPSATFTEVYALAVDVQHALSSLQSLKSPRWRWDGFPDDTHFPVASPMLHEETVQPGDPLVARRYGR
jgi:hypothetical protein